MSKWQENTCSLGGVRCQPVYISIRISTDDGTEYPYTETSFCEKCWYVYGIDSAFEHNKDIRDIAGISD